MLAASQQDRDSGTADVRHLLWQPRRVGACARARRDVLRPVDLADGELRSSEQIPAARAVAVEQTPRRLGIERREPGARGRRVTGGVFGVRELDLRGTGKEWVDLLRASDHLACAGERSIRVPGPEGRQRVSVERL